MIIRIAASNRSIEIDDARNFKAFSVRIEGAFARSMTRRLRPGCSAGSP
jgi:hypothetical protein